MLEAETQRGSPHCAFRCGVAGGENSNLGINHRFAVAA